MIFLDELRDSDEGVGSKEGIIAGYNLKIGDKVVNIHIIYTYEGPKREYAPFGVFEVLNKFLNGAYPVLH